MLIYCEECGKQISDKAPGCPHCGNPRSQPQRGTSFQSEQKTSSYSGITISKDIKDTLKLLLVLIPIVLFVIILGMIIGKIVWFYFSIMTGVASSIFISIMTIRSIRDELFPHQIHYPKHKPNNIPQPIKQPIEQLKITPQNPSGLPDRKLLRSQLTSTFDKCHKCGQNIAHGSMKCIHCGSPTLAFEAIESQQKKQSLRDLAFDSMSAAIGCALSIIILIAINIIIKIPIFVFVLLSFATIITGMFSASNFYRTKVQ